jgi:alkylation response protein AidB-like acyl-CoA dehydrogenase
MSLEYAKQRDGGFGPICNQQIVQLYISEMACSIEAAHLMVNKGAWEIDNGSRNPLSFWKVRTFAIDVAKRAAELTQMIHGSYGYSEEYPVSRFARDITGLQFVFNCQDLLKSCIGKTLLGLPLE